MSTTITVSNTHTAVPINRFDAISESATMLAELLKPECHEHAQAGYTTLVAQHEQLRGERAMLESAQKELVDAKAALKRARSLAALVVPTAINLGKLMHIAAIANFIAADESWLESVEALAARFQVHGDGGKAIAAALMEQTSELRQAEAHVTRATEQADRASQAFSATYRHLSNAITFARAVLNNLGVAMPTVSKSAGKKRKVLEPVTPKAQETVQAPNVVLAPAT